MADKVYVGDIGTIIEIDMQCDISAADTDTLKFLVEKPDGSPADWAPVTISGTDCLRYVIVSGDLNLEGIYKMQPYIEINGWKGKGETVQMTIHGSFE